jgi:signal transduction histidine kinase
VSATISIGDPTPLHRISEPLPRSQEHSLRRLVAAVKELSHARSIDEIARVVRTAAREINGADGATFVLRDRDRCFYFDEDAIAPLWKGKRFPVEACVSGWVMENRTAAAIHDIYADPRVLAEAYLPTFVKSLVMVPVRREAPIAAIGNYWAAPHVSTEHEIELIQALADSTSVAMENVRVYEELEERVRERTLELELANRELDAFSYSVSHDLKTPLNVIAGFADLLTRELAGAPERARRHLQRIVEASGRMTELIDDLLDLGRTGRTEVRRNDVNLTALARDIAENFSAREAERSVRVHVAEGLTANADERLVRVLVENLLSNAFKYTRRKPDATIEVGATERDGSTEYFVRDDGVGFDPEQAGHLFQPFRRLHGDHEFPGTGVGLATCARIVRRHGGRIRAESRPGEGATFLFTLSPAAQRGVLAAHAGQSTAGAPRPPTERHG